MVQTYAPATDQTFPPTLQGVSDCLNAIEEEVTTFKTLFEKNFSMIGTVTLSDHFLAIGMSFDRVLALGDALNNAITNFGSQSSIAVDEYLSSDTERELKSVISGISQLSENAMDDIARLLPYLTGSIQQAQGWFN